MLATVAAATEGYTAADLNHVANSVAFAMLRAETKARARGGTGAGEEGEAAPTNGGHADTVAARDGAVARVLSSATPSVPAREVARLAAWFLE